MGLAPVTFWSGSPAQRLLDCVDSMLQSRGQDAFGGLGVEGADGGVGWVLCLRVCPKGCGVGLWLGPTLHGAPPFRQ